MNKRSPIVFAAVSSIIGILLTQVAFYVHHFHEITEISTGYLALAGTFLFLLGLVLSAISWGDNSLLLKVIVYVIAIAVSVFVSVSGFFLPDSMGEYFSISQVVSQTTNGTGNLGTYSEARFWQIVKDSLLNSAIQILIPTTTLYWVLSHLARKTFISLFKFSGFFFLLSAIAYTVSFHQISDNPLLMFAYISSAVFNFIALITYLFAWVKLLLTYNLDNIN